VTENRPSEAVHFRVAPLAGPSAEEKLLQGTRHAEFWLARIATRAIHGIQIYGYRGFITSRHTHDVGNRAALVKARDAAALTSVNSVHHSAILLLCDMII